MKANELMIGDFVFHEKYGNAIIETIDNDFGDNPSVKLISENIKHKDGYKYGYCWCDLNEIFSIPLTPEILEKNGFVHYEEDEDSFHNEDCVFIKQNLGGYGACLDKIRTVSGIFHYVHELQHALKLCGIDKTIEL